MNRLVTPEKNTKPLDGQRHRLWEKVWLVWSKIAIYHPNDVTETHHHEPSIIKDFGCPTKCTMNANGPSISSSRCMKSSAYANSARPITAALSPQTSHFL